uniref:Uncharacterized protein n=1 Tax=Rhizophora mucronata TaxID=61149 RepID=A0A2P2QD08_RHIMU
MFCIPLTSQLIITWFPKLKICFNTYSHPPGKWNHPSCNNIMASNILSCFRVKIIVLIASLSTVR